jgi:hypothetical protein
MFFPMLPQMYPPQWMPGVMPNLAPVVQAPPGSGGSQLSDMFAKAFGSFAQGFARQYGENLADSFAMQGYPTGWPG